LATSDIYYQYEPQTSYDLVRLLPTLNSAQWSDIERTGGDLLQKLDASRTPALLMDLSEMTYMGSAVVALIVRCWKSLKARNGKLVVVCDNDVVREVLVLAGLDKLWPVVDSGERGLQELGIRKTLVSPVVTRTLALLGLAVAVLAAGLTFTSTPIDRHWLLSALAGGAGVGILAALYAILTRSAFGRPAGLGIIVACAAAAAVGFLR
jgi:anti-anti-sigma factor